MRILLLSVLCCFLLSFITSSEKKAKKIAVSGTVTKTHSYCGGARPNDEILTQLGTPKPFGNTKIYIKAGDTNSLGSKIVMTVTTDANGNFRTKLRPGKYIIVDSTKKDLSYYNMLLKTYKEQTKSYEAIDTLCLKEWHMKPDAVFQVSNTEVKNISVNFRKGCKEDLPCARFRGPFRQ